MRERGKIGDCPQRAPRTAAHGPIAMNRRSIIAFGASGLCLTACAGLSNTEENRMFNVLNRITCVAGERERVASIIGESAKALPGCRLYAVSLDRQDENAIWIYEVWASEQHHAESLKSESVQQAMMAARASITGAERIFAADSFSMAGDNL